jgi:hypothetical protein
MSTKTTFKRIALVAVAALGLGMMTAVPSSAAVVAAGATSGMSTDVSSFNPCLAKPKPGPLLRENRASD